MNLEKFNTDREGKNDNEAKKDRFSKREIRIIQQSLFMIFLIVTLPIVTSDAMAAMINPPIVVHGQHNVPGFRALKDITVVKVSATVPEDTNLDGSQVKILQDPTAPFTCELADENTMRWECTHEYPERLADMRNPVPRFSVQIFNDAGAPLTGPTQGSVTVDANPPRVVGEVQYQPLSGGVVEAYYTVEDTACNDPLCSGKCSGIQSTDFTVSGTSVGGEVDFDAACRQTRRTNLTGVATAGATVQKSICIVMTDKFGQSATKCQEVSVDAKPPMVESIKLYDANGNEVKYTNGQPREGVDMKIVVKEDSELLLPEQSPGAEGGTYIKVNASQLSDRPDMAAAYSDLRLPCAHRGGDEYECSMNNMYLIVTSARSVNVRVQAKDEYDNVLDATIPITLNFDNTPPIATKIYSDWYNDEGKYFVKEGRNTTIFMDITETGSGMEDKYVFMDFAAWGPQVLSGDDQSHTVLFPSACDAGWKCRWVGIGTNTESGTKLKLDMHAGSKDDAFNSFQSPTPYGSFVADVDPPELTEDLISNSTIIGIGEAHPPMELISTGDALQIRMLVRDHSGIKAAYANLSEVVDGGDEEAEGVCEEVDFDTDDPTQRVFQCTWDTPPVIDGYKSDLTINFKFVDYVDHELEYAWEGIEILSYGKGEYDPWDFNVKHWSPEQGIDRMTWGLAPSRMYWDLEINKPESVLDVVSLEFDPLYCAGLDYINQDPETGNFLLGMMGYADYTLDETHDIMVAELNPGNVPEYYYIDEYGSERKVDKVLINCTFIISSIVQYDEGKSITLPEKVQVELPIPVYNNPLGQNIGNIKDKIDEEEDYIDNGFWKFVYWGNYILDYARQICSLISNLMSIMQTISGIRELFSGECNSGVGSAACAGSSATGRSVTTASNRITNALREVYYFCGLFISCRISEQAERSMRQNCAGDSGGWCRVKKAWATVNTWWAKTATIGARRFNGLGRAETGETVGRGSQLQGTSIFSANDFDPTKSIFSSILSLCLPGILLNLEKFRQIKCKRLLCWKIDVPNGRPMWQCDAQYSNEICKFWTGQAFAAFPLFQYIDQIGQFISNLIKNPLSTVLGLAVDKLCQLVLCAETVPNALGCQLCLGAQYASSIAAIASDLIMNTADRFQAIGFDMCEEALKENPSYANIEWPGQEDTTEGAEEEGTTSEEA